MGQLNIITLEQRRESIEKEMQRCGIDAKYWPAITDGDVKQNISRAHKQIIADAKQKGLPYVLIGEDDMRFYGLQAFQYFLDNMPEYFDLYLSSYYTGNVEPDGTIKNFRGLTMYAVSQKYYDTFLRQPETMHLDAALSLAGGRFVVCDKFVCYQEPGYSFQRKRMANDNSRLKGKPIYSDSNNEWITLEEYQKKKDFEKNLGINYI